MQGTGFGMRAAAVFLTTVVIFAAMIVIAHSLKMTDEVAPFRPTAERDLSADEPTEADSAWKWPDARGDLGPLRQVGAVPSEPTPVVTAAPVPDDSDDTALTGAAGDTAMAGAASGDATKSPTSAGAEPDTTVVATLVPSGERGPAPERDPQRVVRREPAPQPAPGPKPQPTPKSTPTPSTDPDPPPVPTGPKPVPTPSEDGSEPASEGADALATDTGASETPTQ